MIRRQGGALALVLRANLRRQAGPLVAVALVGPVVIQSLESLYGFRYRYDWLDLGDPFSDAVALFVLPAAALFAARQGSCESQDAVDWMHETSVRTALLHRFVALFSIVVWPLTGYLLAALVLVLHSFPRHSYDKLPLDAMAGDAAAIAAIACLAYLLGRLVPYPAVAPVAGLLVLLFWQTPAGQALSSPTRRGYTGPPLPVNAMTVYAAPPEWLPWCRPVLFLSTAAAVALFCARRRALAGVVMLALVAAQGALFVSGQEPGVRSAPRVQLRCAGDVPKVCVSAEHERSRSQLTEYVEQLSSRLEGVSGTPTHYLLTAHSDPSDINSTEPGPADTPWAVAVEPADVGIADGYLDSWDLDAMACVIAMGHHRYYSGCDDEPEPAAVFLWLTRTQDWQLTPEDRHQVARLDVLSPQTRTAWLSRYLGAVRRGAAPPALPRVPTDRR
ncbi:hypothetical protein [Streptomyces massasporeus]|uniref:hypothetical protein n=1 Tax=Streptomyces massasporeus TaxID=67324 RepID=UPI0036A30034